MKFVILGSGGRENAFCRKLYSSDKNHRIYCISSYINPQIENMVSNYVVEKNLYQKESLFQHISQIYYEEPDKTENMIVIPGSENFLECGIVDLLLAHNITCIGPLKSQAMIETSKVFCRNYLKYNHLDSYQPQYFGIYNYDPKYLQSIFKKLNYRFVVKADGLCGGKGVRVYDKDNYQEALGYCQSLLSPTGDFYQPPKLLIEERLEGQEFSLISIGDGKTTRHFPCVQDYKDLEPGSHLKTGGMGSVILDNHSFPFLELADIEECQQLNHKIMENLSRDSEIGYRGFLYGGFMKTSQGVKLIEYNARMGDPECLNIMSLLETPLDEIFIAVGEQKLDVLDITFRNEFSICHYLVPQGYPNHKLSENQITLNLDQHPHQNLMFYSALEKGDSGNHYLKNSRTLALVQTGSNLQDCINSSVEILGSIQAPLVFRSDIGSQYGNQNPYLSSGVNVEEGDLVIDKIKASVEKTFDPYVFNNFGDFGGVYDIGSKIKSWNYQNPLLVSSTDGVGTKTKLVLQILGEKKGLHSLGQDIVNHSVNDILVKGARPLFFLDYVASSVIRAGDIQSLLEGMSESCCQNGVSILGGETAEMPGVYQESCYDIVGTIVGMVDKDNMIDGKRDIKEGDLVFGILSDGPHTNGYSLIRKMLDPIIQEQLRDRDIQEIQLGCVSILDFLKPHRSYLEEVLLLQKLNVRFKALCHITGGGYQGNIPRVLPEGLGVNLQVPILEPFATLQKLGQMSNEDMYRIFNCGYGMLVFVKPGDRDTINKNCFFHELGKVNRVEENNHQVVVLQNRVLSNTHR